MEDGKGLQRPQTGLTFGHRRRRTRHCFRAAYVLDDRLDGLARRIFCAQLMGQQTVEYGIGWPALMQTENSGNAED